MKITQKDLLKLVDEETDKIIKEGFLDRLKGSGTNAGSKVADAGRSVANKVSNTAKAGAKSVGDKFKAASDKVGQVAGDINHAGKTSSLKADLQKAIQESGMMVEKFTKTFSDLHARAQSLGLHDEEQQARTELAALNTYQSTASQGLDKPTSTASLKKPVEQPTPSVSDINKPPKPDMQGREEKGGTWADNDELFGEPFDTNDQNNSIGYDEEPLDWDMIGNSLDTDSGEEDATVAGPEMPKSTPKSVDFGTNTSETPFDWRAQKAKATPMKSAVSPSQKPKTSIKPNKWDLGKTPDVASTKLDKTSVKKAIEDSKGDYTSAAKKLGISKSKMIDILQPSAK